MPAFTSRLNLYKPGGGSSGLILPDEVLDVDRLNTNFDAIDAAVGARVVTSGTRPASPYSGQIIFETDTGLIRTWRSDVSRWELAGTTLKLADFNALASLPTAGFATGDLVYITEGAVYMRRFSTGWAQLNTAVFATTAARDTAYAKASGAYLVQGARCYITGLGDAGTDFIYTGSTWFIAGGDVLLKAGAFSTASLTIDGLTADFTGFRLEFASHGTSATLTAVLRTSAPADLTTATYDKTEILGRNSAASSSTVAGTNNWTLAGQPGTRQKHVLDLDFLTQPLETMGHHTALFATDPQVAGVSNARQEQSLTHQDAVAYFGIKVIYSVAQTGRYRLYGKI